MYIILVLICLAAVMLFLTLLIGFKGAVGVMLFALIGGVIAGIINIRKNKKSDEDIKITITKTYDD